MNHLRPATAVFLAYTVILLSNSYVDVNAAYPSTLIWSDCGQDKCAILEFCKDGTNYGKTKTQQLADVLTMCCLSNLNYFSSRSAYLLLCINALLFCVLRLSQSRRYHPLR